MTDNQLKDNIKKQSLQAQIIMNSLHKKRQSFRQAIRHKSIQEIFYRKRQQLLEELKYKNLKETQYFENKNLFQRWVNPRAEEWYQFLKDTSFIKLNQFLCVFSQPIPTEMQQRVFLSILRADFQSCLQKMDLLARLINRKQFSLDQQIEKSFGWKRLISQFVQIIVQNPQSQLYEKSVCLQISKEQKNTLPINSQVKRIKTMVCLCLIKIWQKKPKPEYFTILPKIYHLLDEKVSNIYAMSLIAELSYDKILLPNYNFIKKLLLELRIDRFQEIKIFRGVQILKNYIYNFQLQNSQVHSRQLIFQYINWIKIQANLILAPQNKQKLPQNDQIVEQNVRIQKQSSIMGYEIGFQTKYCLIYLLFTTLNKLFEINQRERQSFSTQQILLMNEELFNQKQNHTVLKFLIEEGKQSLDIHHKKNIFRTLNLYIGYLQVSTLSQEKQQNILDSQLNQIQKTFQGTELNWFQTFN